MILVTQEDFERQVLQSDGTVLLDFWAQWCGPCQMLAPTLEEIAEEREDIKVCKVDVDRDPQLAIRYGINTIPTLLVMENGQVKNKSIGLRSKAQILDML